MRKKTRFLKTILLLIALPLFVFAIKKVIEIRKGAAGFPANITIDTTSPQSDVPSSLWQNFSQGGEEATDMIAPIVDKVRTLEPKLIRLDHLFDYYDVYQGPNSFNFTRLDQAVDSILRTGAKPMLSLSYTPASMAKNNQNAGEPSDWNNWYQLVKATARRYSVEKNISGIYYEVWNEPDLFGGWHYAKSPSYSTLYLQTAKAVKEGAVNSFYKIGGPATTAFYSSWIKSLFATAASNNLRLDFISWHRYSKNIQDYEKDFDNLNQILSDYPAYFDIERLVTEVGPNSEPDSWYDSFMSGIHLISLSSQLYGKFHRFFTFELIDGSSSRAPEKSTGWGLITHSTKGLKIKPRFYAIQFLNQLQGQLLPLEGNGTWVTALATKNGHILQTLLVNYDPRLTHTETTPITFTGIQPGAYNLKIKKYLGSTLSKSIQIPSFRFTYNLLLESNTAYLLELTPVSQ